MTKLFVHPIDPDAPGSYRDRAKLFAIVAKLDEAKQTIEPAATAAAFRMIEEAILPRLATDDGTPVSEALDQLSARDFDALLGGLMGSPDDIVPPATASS